MEKWQRDILEDSHTLIAGCSGSGKSVALRSILTEAIRKSPLSVNLVLIDLKQVELIDFMDAPHTLAYVDKPEEVDGCLETIVNIMHRRFERMKAERKKKTEESHIYIVIDEFAHLTMMCKRSVIDKIKDIALLGRAAGIHLICCTQRNTKEIVSGSLSVNLETRLALRTVCAQDSRNIIGVNGAESLPKYGYGIFQHNGYNNKIKIDLVPDSEIDRLIAYWKKNMPVLERQRKGDIETPAVKAFREEPKKAVKSHSDDDLLPNAEEWKKVVGSLARAILGQ